MTDPDGINIEQIAFIIMALLEENGDDLVFEQETFERVNKEPFPFGYLTDDETGLCRVFKMSYEEGMEALESGSVEDVINAREEA